MSSVNSEDIPHPPPKHRLSPFEVRNTDLVSRLLAATPPYLYNMPLVPHSYFFSEMLRSLVQNKVEAAARMSNGAGHRRSRKRTWAQGRAEHFLSKQDFEPKKDAQEMPPPTWTPPKMIPDRRSFEGKIAERPLELTMNKIGVNNNNNNNTIVGKIGDGMQEVRQSCFKSSVSSTITSPEKLAEVPQNSGTLPMMFPPLPNPNEGHSPSSNTSTDLILPPPPPMWYPPIYPPPYGIDPLHFFIDLRVSGHIYDRKNTSLEGTSTPSSTSSTEITFPNRSQTSAFSVPSQSSDPINLTSGRSFEKSERKFDIKSMGFDSENKQSSNYILKNLVKIYKDVEVAKSESIKEEEESKDGKQSKEGMSGKDLRALIGLELVVDYVNHDGTKKRQSLTSESSTDVDSRCSSTSAVEIVTVPDV